MNSPEKETGNLLLKFGLLAAYFFLPLLGVFLYFQGNWYGFFEPWSLSIAVGILAYGFIMNQFLLGSRLKIADKVFGHDRVLRFHGFMGIFTALLIFSHAFLKNFLEFPKNLQVFFGVGAAFIFMAIIVLSALLMSPIVLTRWKPLVALREFSAKKLRLRYQRLRVVHNLVALAAILVALHVFLASSTSEFYLRRAFMGGWFVAAISVYLYHKLLKPFLLRNKPFIVSRVSEESPGIVTLTFKVPESSGFPRKSGQFAFFKFLNGDARGEEHPFTLSSPADSDEISITVKALGDFTKKLVKVRVGDKAAVDGPYGLFTVARVPEEKPLTFLAGGIGITPFLSILRELVKKRSQRKLNLVWNVRSSVDVFARQELESFKKNLPNFTWKALISRDSQSGDEKGKLNAEYLNANPIENSSSVFLCGPSEQMRNLIEELNKRGVANKAIHFEMFSF